MPRPDTFTNTEHDAGRYEAMTSPDYGNRYADHWDAPSRSDAARDAYLDRLDEERREKERAARRARGEYVSSATMDLEVSSLNWTLLTSVGIRDEKFVASREGVAYLTLNQPTSRAALMGSLEAAYGDRMEFAEQDGTVWARIKRTMLGETFG